jgi:hypothetical protein
VCGFQQFDKVLRRQALDLKAGAQIDHVQQAAVVHAQVQEGVLQIEHAAHASRKSRCQRFLEKQAVDDTL